VHGCSAGANPYKSRREVLFWGHSYTSKITFLFVFALFVSPSSSFLHILLYLLLLHWRLTFTSVLLAGRHCVGSPIWKCNSSPDGSGTCSSNVIVWSLMNEYPCSMDGDPLYDLRMLSYSSLGWNRIHHYTEVCVYLVPACRHHIQQFNGLVKLWMNCLKSSLLCLPTSLMLQNHDCVMSWWVAWYTFSRSPNVCLWSQHANLLQVQ